MSHDDQDRYEMIAHLTEQGLTIVKKSGTNISYNAYGEYIIQHEDRDYTTYFERIKAAKIFMELK